MSDDAATPPRLDAIELALGLYRAPRRADQVRRQALPPGVDLLLRVAGGDERAIEQAQALGEKRGEIVDAARFFVQQALVTQDEDPYRVLGVARDAPLATIKEHHRLLIRFLHPDRSDGSGLDVYAERINRAWNALRTPDRRAETDVKLATLASAASNAPPAPQAVFSRGDAAVRRPVGNLTPWILALCALIAVGAASWAWIEASQHQPAFPLVAATPAPTDGDEASLQEAAVAQPAPQLLPDRMEAPDTAATDAVAVVPSAGSELAETAPIDEAAAAADVGAVRDVPLAADDGADERPAREDPATASLSQADANDAPRADVAAVGGATEPPAPAVELAPERRPTLASAEDVTLEQQERDLMTGPEPEREPVPFAEAPAELPAEPPAAPPVAGIERGHAEAVLADFSAAYARGDLSSFLSLFSADARNNRGGIEAIAEDYRKFFADSGTRRIRFDSVEVSPDDGRAVTTARFTAEVSGRRGKPVRVSGRIEFDLRREAGRVLIERLVHFESDLPGKP